MFVDKVSVFVKAGKGGDGAVSFRHEIYVDKGGPDGGDGGKGGDVIVVGSDRTNTLAKFRYEKEVKAKDGEPGSKRKRHGKSAKPLEIELPVGTVIYNEDNEIVADIVARGQKAVLASGGKGGFGNAHFTSSRRQTPRIAEKGEPGEEFMARMELKLIAEVGLVGLPNAGKSTLLSRVSNAKPEIANYPFTTIVPNLGVATLDKSKSLLIADIPGLIEGAHMGKGLGVEFLRHVERTKVLVHLIDAYTDDPMSNYQTIRNELKTYSKDLAKKPEIVVISKIDGLDTEIVSDIKKSLQKVVGSKAKIFAISSKSGEGLKELLNECAKIIASIKPKTKTDKESGVVISLENDNDAWNVEKVPDGWRVTGKKIERFAVRTDFDSPAGVDRLRDIMRKMGITHHLERKKISPGDKVYFGKQKNQHLEY